MITAGFGLGLEYQDAENASLRHPISKIDLKVLLRCSKSSEASSFSCMPVHDTISHQVRLSYPLKNVVVAGSSFLSGPVDGGSLIDIPGQVTYLDAAFCRFADAGGIVAIVSATSRSKRGTFRCSSPSWPRPSRVLLRVINSEMRSLSADMIFTYYEQPILQGVESSFWNVRISARGMADAIKPTCGFFDVTNKHHIIAVSPSILTTNYEVWCKRPDVVTKEVLVELAANGQDFTLGSGIVLALPSEARVLNITPSMGIARGGTEVTVYGTSFRLSSVALCRFHEVQVPASVLDTNHVVCTSPPLPHKLRGKSVIVSFALVVDGQDVRSSGIVTLNFNYWAFPLIGAIRHNVELDIEAKPGSFSRGNFKGEERGVECCFENASHDSKAVTCKPYANQMRKARPRTRDGEEYGIEVSPRESMTPDNGPLIGAIRHNVELDIEAKTGSFSRGNFKGEERGVECCFETASHDSKAVTCKPYANQMRKARPRTRDGEENGIEVSPRESMTPDNGPLIGGTPVVVTGLKVTLDKILHCNFGERWTQAYVVNATHLICLSSPSFTERVVNFFVSSEGQHFLSTRTLYHYVNAPALSVAQPNMVSEDAINTSVTLYGDWFRNSSTFVASSNEVEHIVPWTHFSAWLNVCSFGRDASRFVRLKLTNRLMDFSSIENGVTFAQRPAVTSEKNSVNLDLISQLHSINVPELTCIPGCELKKSTSWISGGRIRCSQHIARVFELAGTTDLLHISVKTKHPSFVGSDKDSVVTVRGSNMRSGGGETGQAQIPVVSNGKKFRDISAAAFMVIVSPSITNLNPSVGVIDGGTLVTVLGSGFANVTELECHFGFQTALSVTYLSPNEVICQAPPVVLPVIVPVTITLLGVTSTSANYRYVLRAFVLDVSPREVISQELHRLTVTGANFIDGPFLVCIFNGTNYRTTARWVSANVVRCPLKTLKPHSADIAVTVANDGEHVSTSAASILLRPRSVIQSVSPSNVPLGHSIRVTIMVHASSRHLQNFAARGLTLCRFDAESVPASVSQMPTQQCQQAEQRSVACLKVTCTTPVRRDPRKTSLTIVGRLGHVLTNSATFTYGGEPTVYFDTSSGPHEGGTTFIYRKKTTEGRTFLSQTVGCQFWDTFDTVYVPAETSYTESTWSVVCRSPYWRRRSRLQSIVNVGVVVDDILDNGSRRKYVYSNPARLVALTPEWGVDTGGMLIRIQGTGFVPHGNYLCVFTSKPTPKVLRDVDCSTAALAAYISATELVCKSPVCPPGLVYLSIVDDGIQVEGNLKYVIKPSMLVFGLFPSEGPAFGTTAVEIQGSNFFFTGRNTCRFGPHVVTATFMTSHALLCISPSAVPGVYPVSIAMDGENFQDSGQQFRSSDGINILSLSPVFGWTTGGTRVNVHLSGLRDHHYNASFLCIFGSNREAPVSVDMRSSSIVCVSPTLAQTNIKTGLRTSVDVSVAYGMFSISSARNFVYLFPTTVTAVVPDRGQPGSRVQVAGDNFSKSFALRCQFGTHQTKAVFVTSQLVDCHAPAKVSFGQVSVTVVTDGFLPALHTLAKFKFEQASIFADPDRGISSEQVDENVSESTFESSRDRICQFEELEISTNFVKSPIFSCYTSSGGRRDSRISTSLRRELSALNTLSLPYHMKSFISHVTPTHGNLYGGTLIDIEGIIDPMLFNLTCTFTSVKGGSTSSSLELNGGKIRCRTPPSPRLAVEAVRVSITQSGRRVADGASFKFINSPTVRSIHPQTIYKREEERLLIIGQHFLASKDLACRFVYTITDAAAFTPAQFISSSKMSCIIPVWDPAVPVGGYIRVGVTTNGVDYTSAAPALIIQPMMNISRTPLNSGPVTGGTRVTISGALIPNGKVACRFGTSFVPAWSISDTEVICVSPRASNRRTGIVTLDLVVNGREITTNGSFMYLPDAFDVPIDWKRYPYAAKDSSLPEVSDTLQVVQPPPLVSDCQPTSGASSGGVEVAVYGLNFMRSPALTCSFGGVYVKATFLSTVAIKCESPQHSPGDVFLQVSNNGTTFSSSSALFRFQVKPVIFSINPMHGTEESRTLVTILGNNFSNSTSTACRFGITYVPGFYVSSREISCWAPPLEGTGTKVQIQVHPFLLLQSRFCRVCHSQKQQNEFVRHTLSSYM